MCIRDSLWGLVCNQQVNNTFFTQLYINNVLVFYKTRALHLLWGLVCNRQVNNTFFTQLYINNVLGFHRTGALHFLQGLVCNQQVSNTFFTQLWGKFVSSSITSTTFQSFTELTPIIRFCEKSESVPSSCNLTAQRKRRGSTCILSSCQQHRTITRSFLL